MADAHVQPEPAQRGELGDQAADVGVALDGLRAAAGRVAAAGVQAVGQVGEFPVEGVGDGGEVTLVVGDVRRVGLVGEVVGEGEDAGCLGGHCASVRPHRGLAARPTTSYNLRRGRLADVLRPAGAGWLPAHGRSRSQHRYRSYGDVRVSGAEYPPPLVTRRYSIGPEPVAEVLFWSSP